MSDDRMALLELAEKHRDGDFSREIRQFVLRRLRELEAEGRCGVGLHERSAERVNQRNGYREQALETRIGRLQLRVPKSQVSRLCEALDEETDKWQATRRYMSHEVLAQLVDPDIPQALLDARKVAWDDENGKPELHRLTGHILRRWTRGL